MRSDTGPAPTAHWLAGALLWEGDSRLDGPSTVPKREGGLS